MNLRYLEFDYTEDAEGNGSFDAMASALAPQRPALEAELAAVLEWAHRAFPRSQAPLEQGGEWDCALQGVQESVQVLSVEFEPGSATIRVQAAPPGPARTTFDVTLSGTAAFCGAFRRAFSLGGDQS